MFYMAWKKINIRFIHYTAVTVYFGAFILAAMGENPEMYDYAILAILAGCTLSMIYNILDWLKKRRN